MIFCGTYMRLQDKRIISVREAARAQGFPDTYEFKSASKTTRQRIQDVSLECFLSFM